MSIFLKPRQSLLAASEGHVRPAAWNMGAIIYFDRSFDYFRFFLSFGEEEPNFDVIYSSQQSHSCLCSVFLPDTDTASNLQSVITLVPHGCLVKTAAVYLSLHSSVSSARGLSLHEVWSPPEVKPLQSRLHELHSSCLIDSSASPELPFFMIPPFIRSSIIVLDKKENNVINNRHPRLLPDETWSYKSFWLGAPCAQAHLSARHQGHLMEFSDGNIIYMCPRRVGL